MQKILPSKTAVTGSTLDNIGAFETSINSRPLKIYSIPKTLDNIVSPNKARYPSLHIGVVNSSCIMIFIKYVLAAPKQTKVLTRSGEVLLSTPSLTTR